MKSACMRRTSRSFSGLMLHLSERGHHLSTAGEEPRRRHARQDSPAVPPLSSRFWMAYRRAVPMPRNAGKSARWRRDCIRREKGSRCKDAMRCRYQAGIHYSMQRQSAPMTSCPACVRILEEELKFQEQHFPTGLPGGVIHADLFPDNVFFLGGVCSGIIDFYFACNDAFAYEVAICLNAWCFEADASFNLTKGMALLAGYERVRRLEPRERDALPILARGSALRFLLTRLVDWLNVPPGALVKPKDPIEYLRKLRFHQKIASAREFGLAA